MKQIFLFTGLAVLLTPNIGQSQGGITSASNLSNPSAGSYSLGQDSWFARSFRTGPNSDGYVLNSVELLLEPALGMASGFSALIYDQSGAFPGTSLAPLDGPDPAAGGTFTYSATGITLEPSTSYFVVLTSATPVADGAYRWTCSNIGTFDSLEGWTIGPYFAQGNGIVWGRGGGNFQFAIAATPIPEPSSGLLLLIGGIAFAARCARRKEGRFRL